MKKTICDLCEKTEETMPIIEVKVGGSVNFPIDVCMACCGVLTSTQSQKEREAFEGDSGKMQADHHKRMRARIVSAFKSIRYPTGGPSSDGNRKEVLVPASGGQGSDSSK